MQNKKILKLAEKDYQVLVNLAIQEDIGPGDVTTKSVHIKNELFSGAIVSREKGILSGISIAKYILKKISPKSTLKPVKKDGDLLKAGDIIATIKGPSQSLLSAERIILNFLQRLSGIATITGEFVSLTKGTRAKILDTRKTTPGWRILEKHAVSCGGGFNHRLGLYDMIMIKDNHINALSKTSKTPVKDAVDKAYLFAKKHKIKIIVEVDTLEQLEDALQSKANIILLDNMKPAILKKAVKMRDQMAPKILLEASGGVNLKTVKSIAQTNVDRISVGSLTHSVKALDIGLDGL